MTQPVFRFAPSPNGRLHLGHAYSALLNAELAAASGGRFLLRIEDIDLDPLPPGVRAGDLSTTSPGSACAGRNRCGGSRSTSSNTRLASTSSSRAASSSHASARARRSPPRCRRAKRKRPRHGGAIRTGRRSIRASAAISAAAEAGRRIAAGAVARLAPRHRRGARGRLAAARLSPPRRRMLPRASSRPGPSAGATR